MHVGQKEIAVLADLQVIFKSNVKVNNKYKIKFILDDLKHRK